MNSRIKAAGGIVIKDDKILFIKKMADGTFQKVKWSKVLIKKTRP